MAHQVAISSFAVIRDGVVFAGSVQVEEFCLIGCGPEELNTQIGDGAIIRSGTVIYSGNTIGDKLQTGNKANIRESNIIGCDVSIGTLSIIEHHVTIGDNVRIHSHSFVPEYTCIEDDVWVGPNVVITNAKYPNNPTTKNNLSGCHLKKGCMIGANSTILPGVTIGVGSLVGAGSLVTRDVADKMVVMGSPAVETGSIDDIVDYSTNKHD